MKEILDKIISRPIRSAILIGSISAGIASVIRAAKTFVE